MKKQNETQIWNGRQCILFFAWCNWETAWSDTDTEVTGVKWLLTSNPLLPAGWKETRMYTFLHNGNDSRLSEGCGWLLFNLKFSLRTGSIKWKQVINTAQCCLKSRNEQNVKGALTIFTPVCAFSICQYSFDNNSTYCNVTEWSVRTYLFTEQADCAAHCYLWEQPCRHSLKTVSHKRENMAGLKCWMLRCSVNG